MAKNVDGMSTTEPQELTFTKVSFFAVFGLLLLLLVDVSYWQAILDVIVELVT